MKQIIFSLSDLKNVIKKLLPLTKGNSVLAILEDIYVTVNGDRTTFTATDLETNLTLSIDCQCLEEKFSFCVSAQMLLNILNELPIEPVTVNFNEEKQQLIIDSSIGKCTVPTEKTDEYPKPPNGENTSTYKLPKEITEKMKMAVDFVSNDSLRPQMTGVLFDMQQTKLYIVATDAHALFKSVAFDLPDNTSDMQIIIPAKGIQAFLSTIGDKEFTMSLIGLSHVCFITPEVQIFIRLIDAKFPPYQTIIPEYKQGFSIDKSILYTACRFVMVSTNRTTKQVTFDIKDNVVLLDGADADMAKSGSSKLSVSEKSCDDFTFSFNGEKIVNVMDHLQGEKINFHTNGNGKQAFLFTDENQKDIILLMPLMVTK